MENLIIPIILPKYLEVFFKFTNDFWIHITSIIIPFVEFEEVDQFLFVIILFLMTLIY